MSFVTEEIIEQDPEYWNKPLFYRAYLRLLYGFTGFVVVGSIFDVILHAPFILQLIVAVSTSIGVMLFRIAYPAGVTNVFPYMFEAMAEAQKDAEKQGLPYKGALSSQELQEVANHLSKNKRPTKKDKTKKRNTKK